MQRHESREANHSAAPTPYIRGMFHRETALSITTAFTIDLSQVVRLSAVRDHECVQRQRLNRRLQ